MSKNLSVATRMDSKLVQALRKIFPKENTATILRIVAEEFVAVQKNTENLYAARKGLSGKKSDRSFL